MAAPPPTPYAKKYGQRPGSHKSGLTPLDYLFPSWILEKGDITRQQAEDFQRKKLQGFTTRELTQLDAITASSRNLPPATLANDIIPLLQKYRWEKTPPKAFTRTDLYPLSNGNGLWVMDNPEVARIMEPILRLASRILLSSYMLPWLDAFLNGERRSIPEHRIPEKYKRTSTPEETASKAISFHLRPNVDPQATAIRRDQVFEGLMTRWNYTFGFSSPNEDPRGPHFNQDLTRQYAETLLNNEQMKYEKDTNPTWGVWTYIGYSDVELLLRDDLNDADRLCLEWVTANVIVHEVIHAMAYFPQMDQVAPLFHEPYFENEALMELGFSFEHAVNGGTTTPFVSEDDKLPLGNWLVVDWPTWTHRNSVQKESFVLTDPGPLEYLRRYPVPVSLYSDIQREDFWQLGVRNFGHMLLSYRHLQVGVQINIKLLPKNGGGFRWVYGDPQRIGPYSRLTAPAIAMGRKLEELKAIDIGNLATLTPDELALLNFVKRLLLSSQVEGQLWTNSTAQRDTVQEIFKSIQQLGVQPQRKWQIFASIMNMIRQASENHDIMVASTSSLEAINGTSYTDRRKDLLAWNRGTRAFMQRMLEISRMSPDQSHTVLLNEDLHKLERCRMHLWYPDSPIKDVPDYVEIEQLMRARHANVQGISIQECRDLCQTIRSVPGCSMTVQCCAEIILAGTLIGEPQGWEDRLAELQNNKQLLNSLRWGSGNGWWPTLESWVDLAKQIIATMNLTRRGGNPDPNSEPLLDMFNEPGRSLPGP